MGRRSKKQINLDALKRAIQWRGTVRLDQLNEDDESLLAEVESPPGSGQMMYVCVITGLLYDKQTGACRQSTVVSLKLSSLSSASPADFKRFWAGRRSRDSGLTSRHLIVED